MESLASTLNTDSTKRDWIKSKHSTFDTAASIVVAVFSKYLPSYAIVNFFYIKNRDHNSTMRTTIVRLSSFLLTTMATYMLWLYKNQVLFSWLNNIDENNLYPSQNQIYDGYDAQNNLVGNSKLLISAKNTEFNFTIDNLKEETLYEVYLIGGSIHPGYPD